MDIRGKTIWQQAAGDKNRNFVDLCLKWDVILNGPGSYGTWPECENSLREAEKLTRKVTDLRRFCEQIKDGDFVVLRLGTDSIYGVGQIIGEYEWCDNFNDVDGWDIGHVRRVSWFWKYKERPKEFDIHTLKLGDTTQRLDAPAVESWLESLEIPDAECERTPIDLPETSRDASIRLDTISEYLFDSGVASNSIVNLLDQMDEFVRIANWYNRSGANPSENETVSYLVVPLLRALGWTPQKMAIEWNRIDVALFSHLPRTEESLCAVVEAKQIRSACLSAFSQAKYYAEKYKNCRHVILTNGLRYGVFIKGDESSLKKQELLLHAYMNLTRLRDEYPVYECRGAKDALWAMSPEWDHSSQDRDLKT